jgi:phosphoribosyl 1,2-cyclic phosphodiesterase
MKVKFWGTRGSIPVPGKDTIEYGGNTTCLEITLEGGKTVIVDAGTGIRPLGRHLSASEGDVDIHLLITHIHWDHVVGFPFFEPIYEPTSKISIDGFHTCMKGLRTPFENKMGDGFWPIRFEDLKADIRYLDTLSHGPLYIDDAVIDTIHLQHPQGGFGFRFREGGRTLVFITDNELKEDAWQGGSPEDYAQFCRGADLLIHDAQYTPEEKKDRNGWGHSDYVTVLNLAMEARVKKLLLFHHDPSRKDPEVASIKAHCEDLAMDEGADILVDAAREGSELTV